MTRKPLLSMTWVDPVTGIHGYLIIHSLVSQMATGGTRMRAGCTMQEVEDLARGMSLKAAMFGLPVGGAKGGIDCDPKDPQARGVLTRFCSAMRPWLERYWVTAEDLGVPQQLIDEVFSDLGMQQSYHAALNRANDSMGVLQRVTQGLNAKTNDGFLLGDVVGGYGVAQACLGVAEFNQWELGSTTVSVQGVGTMGGSTAFYLNEAGVNVTTISDAQGTLYKANGLPIPELLALRDRFGEIDRNRLPDDVEELPIDAIYVQEVDIFVPAAISYAIDQNVAAHLPVKVVVEAANSPTTQHADQLLAKLGIPVIPDFVANAGAVAWAWWILLDEIGSTPDDSFWKIRTEMRSKVQQLMEDWENTRTSPRITAINLSERELVTRAANEAWEYTEPEIP